MTYVPTRLDPDGNLPIKRNIEPNAPTTGIGPGEIGVDAASGTIHLGTADGRLATMPAAKGFNRIVSITQAAYDALDPKDSQTLYVVTAGD